MEALVWSFSDGYQGAYVVVTRADRSLFTSNRSLATIEFLLKAADSMDYSYP